MTSSVKTKEPGWAGQMRKLITANGNSSQALLRVSGVNTLNFKLMFFVKTKSKRKNVITYLTVLLLMVGGILLESTLSEKSQIADCACPDETQVNMQQEAGWFFGRHKTSRGTATVFLVSHYGQTRVLPIINSNHKGGVNSSFVFFVSYIIIKMKLLLKIKLLLLGLCLMYAGNLQAKNIKVSGYIRDSLKNSIPYSSIIIKNTSIGTFSDVNGYFELEINQFPLTLVISNVGYNKKEIFLSSLSGDLEITLNEKIIILNEVVITSENEVERLFIGCPKKTRGSISRTARHPFEQWGLTVRNKGNQLYRQGKLISALVKITPPPFGIKPDGSNQIRLRIYNIKNESQIGQDILQKNIFLSPKKGGWYKIDMTDIDLILPKKGFIVAIEWLENQPLERWGEDAYDYTYGLSITASKTNKLDSENYATLFFNPLKMEWAKEYNDIIPAIRLEIEEYE